MCKSPLAKGKTTSCGRGTQRYMKPLAWFSLFPTFSGSKSHGLWPWYFTKSSIIAFLTCALLFCNNYKTSQSVTVKNLELGRSQVIVTYGTSLTYGGGWVEQLSTLLHDKFKNSVSIINCGHNGANSYWGLQNIRERVVSKHPDCVFIEFTMNDVCSSTITREISKINLSNIIDTIWMENPLCEIVLMTMNPRTDGYVSSEKMEDYYAAYRELAQERSCTIVDNYIKWKDLELKNRGLFNSYIPDGCHPTDLGCEVIVTPNILRTLGFDILKSIY